MSTRKGRMRLGSSLRAWVGILALVAGAQAVVVAAEASSDPPVGSAPGGGDSGGTGAREVAGQSTAALSSAPQQASPGPEDPAFRLDPRVRPLKYTLSLSPSFDAMIYHGEVDIRVSLAEPVERILLHSRDLTLGEVTIWQGIRRVTPRVIPHAASETIELSFTRPLNRGEASLHLSFKGQIGSRPKGLHGEVRDGERYLVTELEPDGARRVFPCFDEPGFKAPFDLSVTIARDLVALSNGSVMKVQEDAARGTKTVTFETSPLMSTYLLTVAVGDFVSRQAMTSPTVPGGRPVPVAVWSLKSKEALTGYALETLQTLLPRQEARFGLPYPYSKLDLIVVPQYQGAMENTAAMFFAEFALIDPKRSSEDARRSLANTIAHEVAHQWFGNWVTTSWWDDLWLNEAFATWMATGIIDEWKPEWRSGMEERIQSRQWILMSDAQPSTHSIRAPVRTTEEAEDRFDGITYTKGAMVLSMLEHFVGQEVFWNGVKLYLTRHAHGTAHASDLWKALSEAAQQPLEGLARAWFEQAGYPLVQVRKTCNNGWTTLELKQERLLLGGDSTEKDRTFWPVPMPLRYDMDKGVQREWFLLTEPESSWSVEGCGFLYPNDAQQGFFRVRMPGELTEQLLLNDRARLSEAERSALLSDSWALVQAGIEPLESFLRILPLFHQESSRLVIESVWMNWSQLGRLLDPGPSEDAYRHYSRALAEPHFQRLGWDPRPGESEEDALLRPMMLLIQLHKDNRPALLEARRRVEAFLEDPVRNPIPPTHLSLYLNAAARVGDVLLWERYLSEYRTRKLPSEQYQFLFALGSFVEPELIQRTRERALLEKDKGGRIGWLLFGGLGRRETRDETWRWIVSSWPELKNVLSPEQQQAALRMASSFCTPVSRKEVADFFSSPENKIEQASRALEQTLERIDQCILDRERFKAPLETWLAAYAAEHMTGTPIKTETPNHTGSPMNTGSPNQP